jgi:amino-acid N-acetyltransferase
MTDQAAVPGVLRKAAVVDVPAVHRLILTYAERGAMLAVPLSKLYDRVRNFFVYEVDGQVVACAALHVLWEDLGEVRSLAVSKDWQGRGIARELVEACVREARELCLPRVFCLTYVPGFFTKLGFAEVDKSTLPHKVWADCINCPHFPDCNEVPLVRDLAEPERGKP